MNIYTTLTVEDILSIIKSAPSWYYRIFKREHREFYDALNTHGIGKTFSERLYNHCYPGEHKCLHCGSHNVGFLEFTTGYRNYCSKLCATRSEATKAGARSLYADPVRMKQRADSTRATCLQKYGSITPSGNAAVAKKMSTGLKETWHKKCPREINGRSIKQYRAACRHLTNKVYSEFQYLLDPNKLRSFDWVLDHIYSLQDGFVNNVPLNVICHPSNLVLISKSENSSKGFKSRKTLESLYEDYENFQSS